MRIAYVYPKWHKTSFTIVSQHHIEYLKDYFDIDEIDEIDFKRRGVVGHYDVLILHPLFFITELRYDRLRCAREKCDVLVGFEVSDSDRISNKAVDIANKCDLIIVPSSFAKYSFVNSGVKVRIEVVPHGVSDYFMSNEVFPSDPRIRRLLVGKTLNGYVYVLYFLWHSGFRKGADLVYKVMREIQREYSNVYLVVKRGDIEDPYMSELRRLRCFEVSGWISEKELVALYDVCDICVVPSRGGGFELNAIEALARGLPTLVPRWGCFLDYIEYCVPVDVESYVRLFGDNPVHVGRGASVSVLDFYFKLKTVIDDLEEYKERFRRRSKEVREKYSWRSVGKKLVEVFRGVQNPSKF